MKRFLTTTAIAIVMGSTAIADSHGAMNWDTPVEASAGQFYGSDLIGMRVYRADNDYESGATVDADAQNDWDDIGEIDDLIISKDGEVEAVILGIGGFLGIGEREVAVRMDSIRVVSEKDDPDDRFLVVNATRENLEAIPAYERRVDMDGDKDMKADKDMAKDDGAMDGESKAKQTTQANDDAVVPPAMTRPQVQREGYTEVKMTEAQTLNTEELTGARVYGANDEDIGEISELIVENDKLAKAVIDVGGFLGIGEKPVAVDFDKLQILQHGDDGSLVVYMDATEDSLKALPEYEG